jgi:RNA polymerase sigma-70 factor (ECF subfamily)
MAKAPMDEAVRRLRQTVLARDGGGLSDGELLERFVARREEAAFEALVRRLGPMVLGLCRRILRNHHDAEDAFQAAFLVLARKAASVRPPERVGPFLYGVAYHTARKVRAQLTRRRRRETPVDETPEPAVREQGGGSDLWPVLDEEVCRLAEKYRAPVVLCDLEGLTRKEAAHRLGWPEGTVSGRLSRARALLARRLSRRGVTLAAALTAGGANSGTAAVPAALVRSTVRAAGLWAAGKAMAPRAILTEGVVRSMFLSKGRIAVIAVLVAGLIGGGLRWLAQPPAEAEPPPRPPQAAPAHPQTPQTPKTKREKTDRELLQGQWWVTEFEEEGKRYPAGSRAVQRGNSLRRTMFDYRWCFEGDQLLLSSGTDLLPLWVRLDSSMDPKRIDLTYTVPGGPQAGERKTFHGIYRLEGKDRLVICLAHVGLERVQRPAELETKPGVPVILYTLRRVPPDKEVLARVARVGQVFIVGNEKTPQDVILKHLSLFPGQVLTYPDIKASERNLTKQGINATITILNPENDSAFKDILISVQEGKTGSLQFGIGPPKAEDKKPRP